MPALLPLNFLNSTFWSDPIILRRLNEDEREALCFTARISTDLNFVTLRSRCLGTRSLPSFLENKENQKRFLKSQALKFR